MERTRFNGDWVVGTLLEHCWNGKEEEGRKNGKEGKRKKNVSFL